MSGQPYVAVKVAGVDLSARLVQVVLDEDEFRADALAFTLYDPTPIWIDVLNEGMPVELELGTPEDHPVAFRGKIWRIEADFRHPRSPSVTCHALDLLAGMAQAPQTAKYWGVNVASVATQIISAAGLVPGTLNIPRDAVAKEDLPLQQAGQTNLEFLFRLVYAYNCRLYVEHGPTDLVHIRPIADLLAQPPLADELTFPTVIDSFAPTFDVTQTVKGLKIYGPDRATGGKAAPVEAAPRDPSTASWTVNPAALDKVPEDDRATVTELALAGQAHRLSPVQNWPGPWELMAEPTSGVSNPYAEVDESRWRGAQAWAEGQGYHLIRPRIPVTIGGVGGRFSGPWYVSRAIHTVDVPGRGYRTRFRCCR
jgi:phage protein D